MDGQAARIDALVMRLQTLTPEVRWATADEALIAATAMGEPGNEGPNTRRVRGLIVAAGNLGVAYLLVCVLSFVQLFRLWLLQRRAHGKIEPWNPGCLALFVGIRALKERELTSRFEARIGNAAHFVDQREELSLRSKVQPGWRALYTAWREAGQPALAALRRHEIPLPEAPALASIVRRWHSYAYFLAAFRQLREMGAAGPIGFSTADMAAFAARAAGLKAIYYQHGFLRRSLVFPDFDEIVALNRPEANHLARRAPGERERCSDDDPAPDGAERGNCGRLSERRGTRPLPLVD